MDRMLEMMFAAPTNVGKHIALNIPCASVLFFKQILKRKKNLLGISNSQKHYTQYTICRIGITD